MQRYPENDTFIVPEGLHELLADISREVLRKQPEDLLDFIAGYLEAMLVSREILQIEESLLRHVLEDASPAAKRRHDMDIAKSIEYGKKTINLEEQCKCTENGDACQCTPD